MMPLLNVLGLSFKVQANSILKDIELDLVDGQTAALVGPSGSGKTTLAKIIKGFLSQTEGEVCFQSRALSAQERIKNSEIQLVFQNPFESFTPNRVILDVLYEYLTRYQHLSMSQANDTLAALCQNLQIYSNHLKSYPHELSGGEMQRIALLRALLAKPKLLICDEVFSALDSSLRAEAETLLFNYQKKYGVTILLITHDLSSIDKRYDKLIVIEEGRLTAVGTPKEVLEQSESHFIQQSLGAMGWLQK